jgi:hypothetical protein
MALQRGRQYQTNVTKKTLLILRQVLLLLMRYDHEPSSTAPLASCRKLLEPTSLGQQKFSKTLTRIHGFIAQEVKAAIDADSSIKDGFRLWDDREDGSQEVAEAALIPVLVKAVQELSAQVNSLTTRLEALEGR